MRIGVLGAGPAAGAAALEMVRGGLDVTVFVPARPGEKPCGGALPEYLLDELGALDISTMPSVRSPLAVLENAAGRTVSLGLSGLRIFRRSDLDGGILRAAEAAGACLVRARARGLELMGGEIIVSADDGSRRFDWLVGADGARGLSRRWCALPPGKTSIGLGASLRDVDVETLFLGFPDLADGYQWIFPRPGGCSVGIAYSEDSLSTGAARASLDAFVSRHLPRPLENYPGPRYRYPIPVFSPDTIRATRIAAARRVLLVGDAAGVADPLTREGIRHAVRSARLAADCLLCERPAAYSERLDNSLRAEMSRAHRAAELFYEDPIGQWMVPVCRSHPGVRRVLADLLSCRQPYEGLRRRLLRAALEFS